MTATRRTVKVYDLPISEDVEILRPEQVILRFSHGRAVDVGALCYLKREFTPLARVGSAAKGRVVNEASRSIARTTQVRALIKQISAEALHGAWRPETLRDRYSRFVTFMGWADANGWQNALSSVAAAKEVFQAYSVFIRERVRQNELSLNSGSRQQMTVLIVLSELFAVDDLGRGIHLLRTDEGAKEATVPPSADTQARALGLCTGLFHGLTALVVDQKPYPFALEMPAYLGLRDNKLSVFPTNSWFMSPAMLARRKDMSCPGWGYNYTEGRLSTLAELQSLEGVAGDCDIQRRTKLKKAKDQLEAANFDSRHPRRVQAGMQAMNMFIIMFLAQTGMNWAQVVEQSWNDNFEVDTPRQAFRAIKWRAGGKLVSFELPLEFMPTFKRFLILRTFLLNGESCPWLFFKRGTRGEGLPTKIRSSLNPVFLMLCRIDSTLPKVLSRQWRAAKSDWLIKNTDPATAALVLQNTEKTVLTSYAAGSEAVHIEEMSAFLTQISTAVVSQGEAVNGGVACAVGVCAAYGDPASATASLVVQPDCKGPEGCLFCDKFKVHADANDTRKLLSCRHCLRRAAPLMGSEERIQGLLGPIFDRIQLILDEIAKRDHKMVERVTKEVDEEGELDAYWARKLEMMMDAGVVS